jgi:PAS domain S-box-containing protein
MKALKITPGEPKAQSGGYSEKLTALNRAVERMSGGSDGDMMSLLLEELKLCVDMLKSQDRVLEQLNEALDLSRRKTERERRRYDELINYHPVGCLITDMNGKIVSANREAASLLNIHESLLAGKYMVLFLEEGERKDFNRQLEGRFRVSRRLRYRTRLQPCQKEAVDATLLVSAVDNGAGQPASFFFLLQPSE